MTQPPRAANRLSIIVLAPFVLSLIGAVIVTWTEPPRRSQAVQTFTIPEGTAARVAAGLRLEDVLPPRISTDVGSELVIANRDRVNHVFGPFVLIPGQEWHRTFAMAGEYGFACSVYPDVGFTIDVAPPPEAPPLAAGLTALWAVALLAATTLAAGAVAYGVAAPQGSGRDPLGATGLGGAGLGAAAGAWVPGPWVPGLGAQVAALMPGTAFGLAAAHAVTLSRTAPWADTLASRALPAWLGSVALASAALILVRVAPRVPWLPAGTPAAAWLMPGIAAAVGLWPVAGPRGALAGFAVVGAGLFLASLVAQSGYRLRGGPVPGIGGSELEVARSDQVESVTPPGEVVAVRRPGPGPGPWPLALAGVGLFVVGLPWPAPDPPVLAVVGLVGVAAGLVSVLSADASWSECVRFPVATRALNRLAGGMLAFGGFVAIWAGGVGYMDVSTVPLGGNPMPADADSIGRGQALYQLYCADCHTSPPAADHLSDTEAFRLISRGAEGMPGFGYDLDQEARGDVLNYLRSLSRTSADSAKLP